jgi:hypothetical protein
MKAYKVELLILDHDNIGVCEETFCEDFEYLFPKVMSIHSKDIGEWDDDHPLNQRDQCRQFYEKLFKENNEST